MVLYEPPVVKMFDIDTNDSVENMVVNQDGNFLLFSSTPVQVAMHPDSDPGCDIDVAVVCPKQGIKKIVMNLGAMNDSGEFDLDSNTANKIKQIAKGGCRNDDPGGSRRQLRSSRAARATTSSRRGPLGPLRRRSRDRWLRSSSNGILR